MAPDALAKARLVNISSDGKGAAGGAAEQITSQITTANTRLANAEDRLITQEAAIRDMPRRIIEALKN